MSIGSKIVIAVDIGTTSTKTLAIDEAGRLHGSHSIGYPLNTPKSGYAEQDPYQMYHAVIDSIATVMTSGNWSADDVLCVTFSSANHSLIAVDRDGRPLTQVITWADLRSVSQAEKLQADGRGLPIYLRTGTPIHPMSPLTKLIWMQENQPEVFRAAHKFIGIKEYILYRLFGEYVMDYSLASATGLFQLETLSWDQGALEAAGISEEQLPRLAPTTERLTGLNQEAATHTGLNVNTPFVLGAQDGVLANLGIGAVDEGVLAVTIGTSGAVRSRVARPTFDPEGRLFCYALTEDHWFVGGATNNGAIVAQWMTERLFPGRNMDELMPLAGNVPAGSNGLLFLPLLSGERAPFWDANAKGVMFGLTLSHNENHMLRAALEGVMFQISSIVSLMEQAGGKAKEVRASGGFARSPLWCQMMADMLGVSVQVPDLVESSGLGAAQLGLYAMEEKRSPLLRWKDIKGVSYEPSEANHRVYRDLLPFYLNLYHSLKDQMRNIPHV